MRKLGLIAAVLMLASSVAHAQVQLDTYADAKGNIDVQKLTCAQLANTFQEDADFMSVWYSGWYNGLANFSKMKIDRAKEAEHRVIVYCKEHPDTKVIKAMDIIFKQLRKEAGITVKDEQ
jgi:HdeA/HdeB family